MRPNIIFIMADDMGYGDVACYNAASKIPTPHMDRLAREGMRFTDAHSASAVCTPSRYAVLTGKYGWRSVLKKGVLNGFGAPLIHTEDVTVASLLKERGYATAAIGKWHLGLNWTNTNGESFQHKNGSRYYSEDGFDIDYEQGIAGGPTDLGFDYWFGISGSLDMPPYGFIENNHFVTIPDREKSPYYNQQRPGLMSPDWQDEAVDTHFATKSVAFIEKHVQSRPEQPFFLYMTPASPHRPCDIRPDFVIGKSQAGDRGDMVYLFDWIVGQVMDAVDRLNIAEKTLIIVTSDNGARLVCANGQGYGHQSNAHWRGQKADIWDGGHREPFIARWTGTIPANTESDTLICLSDLLATCAEISAISLSNPGNYDSVSFLSQLTRAVPETKRSNLVHHSASGMFSIREGNWKFIMGQGSGGFSDSAEDDTPGQLYDLDADPREMQNLWFDYPDRVADLSQKLRLIVGNDSEIISS